MRGCKSPTFLHPPNPNPHHLSGCQLEISLDAFVPSTKQPLLKAPLFQGQGSRRHNYKQELLPPPINRAGSKCEGVQSPECRGAAVLAGQGLGLGSDQSKQAGSNGPQAPASHRRDSSPERASKG